MVDEDFFTRAEGVDGVGWWLAEKESIGGDLVELGVSVVGVIGVEVRLVRESEGGRFLSGRPGKGNVGGDGFSEEGAAVFGPFKRLGKDGALPAGVAAALGMEEVPPLGAVG